MKENSVLVTWWEGSQRFGFKIPLPSFVPDNCILNLVSTSEKYGFTAENFKLDAGVEIPEVVIRPKGSF